MRRLEQRYGTAPLAEQVAYLLVWLGMDPLWAPHLDEALPLLLIGGSCWVNETFEDMGVRARYRLSWPDRTAPPVERLIARKRLPRPAADLAPKVLVVSVPITPEQEHPPEGPSSSAPFRPPAHTQPAPATPPAVQRPEPIPLANRQDNAPSA